MVLSVQDTGNGEMMVIANTYMAMADMHQIGILDMNIMDVEKGYGPGIEASCKFVYDYVDSWVKKHTKNRVKVKRIEIWEHENNSAIYEHND